MGIEENIERIANALERIASTQEENTKINAWYKKHLSTLDAIKAGVYQPSNGFNAEEGKEVLDRLDQEAMNAATTAAQGVASAPAPVPVTEAPAPAAPVAPEEPVASEGPTQEMILAAAHVSADPTALTALGRDLTFDILKQELLARGHAYKKGTKATTLQKEWDLHKYEPIIGAKPTPSPLEPPQVAVNPVGYAPSLTAAPVAPAPVVQPTPPVAPAPGPFSAPAPAPAAKAPMSMDEAYARIMETYQKPEGKPQAECDFDVECMKKALAKVGAKVFKQVPEGQFEIVVAEYERLKGIAHA